MEPPLWTETYRPSLAELPQEDLREYLQRAVDEPMNLLLQGPPGAGKTAAVRALADAAHDDPDNDLVVVNVADFFDRTKSDIRSDPRFSGFLVGKSDLSKRDMLNHVLREVASYAPASGGYKTLALENAESVREDFQQALRRVMERYHGTTQFVLTTRQPTKLIPPIRSRCFPVPVRAPSAEETEAVLAGICEDAGVEYDDDGLGYVATYADGDLRRAVLAAQATAEAEGAVTTDAAYETLCDVGMDDHVEAMLAAAEDGEFEDARSALDDLLYDEGWSGEEVLSSLLEVADARYGDDRLVALHRLAGDVDFDLAEGSGDRVHLAHLLAEVGADA